MSCDVLRKMTKIEKGDCLCLCFQGGVSQRPDLVLHDHRVPGDVPPPTLPHRRHSESSAEDGGQQHHCVQVRFQVTVDIKLLLKMGLVLIFKV